MRATQRPLATSGMPPTNRLLAGLPPDVLARVAPTIDVIPLELKRFLYKAGEPIYEVYFPGGGFCSMVTVLSDGRMIEVATIGREGMVGLSAALNGHGDPMPSATMVQAETDVCYRMPIEAFRVEMERGRAVSSSVHPIRPSPCRIHHAVDGLQRRPHRRAATGAMALDGT